MRKILFPILISVIVLGIVSILVSPIMLFMSCETEPEKVNSFVGMWKNEYGFRTFFTK
jgi:hypothetical protein